MDLNSRLEQHLKHSAAADESAVPTVADIAHRAGRRRRARAGGIATVAALTALGTLAIVDTDGSPESEIAAQIEGAGGTDTETTAPTSQTTQPPTSVPTTVAESDLVAAPAPEGPDIGPTVAHDGQFGTLAQNDDGWRLLLTDDGSAWQATPTAGIESSAQLTKLGWQSGTYVAVFSSADGGDALATSTDMVNWSTVDLGTEPVAITDVAADDGELLVLGGEPVPWGRVPGPIVCDAPLPETGVDETGAEGRIPNCGVGIPEPCVSDGELSDDGNCPRFECETIGTPATEQAREDVARCRAWTAATDETVMPRTELWVEEAGTGCVAEPAQAPAPTGEGDVIGEGPFGEDGVCVARTFVRPGLAAGGFPMLRAFGSGGGPTSGWLVTTSGVDALGQLSDLGGVAVVGVSAVDDGWLALANDFEAGGVALFRSTDGAGWERTDGSVAGFTVNDVLEGAARVGDRLVLAGTCEGKPAVWTSSDEGRTWAMELLDDEPSFGPMQLTADERHGAAVLLPAVIRYDEPEASFTLDLRHTVDGATWTSHGPFDAPPNVGPTSTTLGAAGVLTSPSNWVFQLAPTRADAVAGINGDWTLLPIG